jgi:thioredoxin 1
MNSMDELEAIRRKRMDELLGRSKMAQKAMELTDETFGKETGRHELMVVDCWAPWCGPCRMMSPVIDELARDYAGKIAFGKLNVDDNGQAAERHQIMSIPTLLVFKRGKLVDRITGAMPRARLEPLLTRHLGG